MAERLDWFLSFVYTLGFRVWIFDICLFWLDFDEEVDFF